MGYTKDLWTRPGPDGKRVPSERHGTGKRWLACWLDPEGRERTKAFGNKKAAERYWQAQKTDVERGDYRDPKAGRELFGDIAKRWLAIQNVDPKTEMNYERAYRLHIRPEFGHRPVKAPKTSEIAVFLAGVSAGNRGTVRMVLSGIFALARVDDLIRKNPVSSAGGSSKPPPRRVRVWADDVVGKLIDAHPPELRVAPIILAGCGLRESELYGLDVGDITDGDEPVLSVRQQIKRLDAGQWVYAMPKGDKDRDVPLSAWVAQSIRVHREQVKPLTLTLPWERPDGKPVTHRLLVPYRGEFLRPAVYNRVWKPALTAAGIIDGAAKDRRGRMVYPSDRHAGRHALRHYYASVQLAGGVGIPELAVYLGHHDPGFTLRVYGHLLPDSHERSRKAIDERLFRPRAVGD